MQVHVCVHAYTCVRIHKSIMYVCLSHVLYDMYILIIIMVICIWKVHRGLHWRIHSLYSVQQYFNCQLSCTLCCMSHAEKLWCFSTSINTSREIIGQVGASPSSCVTRLNFLYNYISSTCTIYNVHAHAMGKCKASSFQVQR